MLKKLVKTVVPAGVIGRILKAQNSIRSAFDRYVVPAAASSYILSQLYYLLFSRAFAREQNAVLYGRLKYSESIRQQEDADEFALLRRNTHRLEKGLLMRPRRDVFALGYIEETTQAFARRAEAVRSGAQTIDVGELAWSHDVLNAYFQAVTDDQATIQRARALYETVHLDDLIDNLPVPERSPSSHRVPYHRTSDPSPVSYADLRALAMQRRSVRWFADKNVSRETLDQAMAIAAEAPSACNRQPFEFRIYDNPELVQKLASFPGGTKGYADNIPVLVVIVGRLRAYFNERDRHVIYIDASLAAMSYMLALETLGLSSCSINWPDVENRETAMQEALNLEPDERPVMLLAVGYPDEEGKVAYSQKKDLDRIRSYNKR